MKNMETYLQACCDTHDWIGFVVVGEDGLLLARVGHGLDDGCTALLPRWLEEADNIATQGDLDGISCCCMMPKNMSAMILTWRIHVENEGALYFAIRTRKVPRQVVRVLKDIGNDVQHMLFPDSPLNLDAGTKVL